MNKRLLFLMASLLLCGAVSAQNYWGDDPNSHAQPSNTPIVASVTMDGTAVTTSNALRLGAFVGEELRGIAAQHTDGNFWIQVFYTDANDNITFKFYDGTDEYTTCETTLTGSEEGYGTPSNPKVIEFTNSQISPMASGWNWWSTYVEITDGATALTMVENSLGSNGLLIKHKNEYLEPFAWGDDILWIGDIESISNEKLYMIKVDAPCDIVVNGGRASAANHEIQINHGWNWIGYPHYQQLVLEDALSGFAEEGDIIKNRVTYNEYFFGMWIGDIVTLDPGQGYMYYSNSNSTKYLTYQTEQTRRVEEVAHLNSQSNNFFVPNTNDYARNMTITTIVEIDGEELSADSYEVAAFVDGECRGSAKIKYVEPIDQYVALLLVFGDDNEDIYFELANGNDTKYSVEQLHFSADSKVGSLSDPFVLHFNNTGIGTDNQVFASIYPNPSKGVFNIHSIGGRRIEVIDAFGQIVLSKEIKEDYHQIDLSKMANGVYLLRIITDDGIIVKQLIKE